MSEMPIKDTREEKKCKFCDKSMENRMQCHGMKHSSWKYLFENEACHMECYIEHCVKMYLLGS